MCTESKRRQHGVLKAMETTLCTESEGDTLYTHGNHDSAFYFKQW